jgi:hypothetical protein
MSENIKFEKMYDAITSMHKLVIEMQAGFAATQFGFLAVVEQLGQQRLLDGEAAAERMRRFADCEPNVTGEAKKATRILAEEVKHMAANTDPRPPRGGKPTLVR